MKLPGVVSAVRCKQLGMGACLSTSRAWDA